MAQPELDTAGGSPRGCAIPLLTAATRILTDFSVFAWSHSTPSSAPSGFVDRVVQVLAYARSDCQPEQVLTPAAGKYCGPAPDDDDPKMTAPRQRSNHDSSATGESRA